MDIVNRKHHAPAYYRYRENHPTISVVLTKELKDLLDSQKRGATMSYSQLTKKLINQAYDLDQARREGYEEGYAKGLNDGEKKSSRECEKYKTISLGKCSCGKPLYFRLDNPEDLKLLTQTVSDRGLVHEGCPPKPIIWIVS